MIGQHSETGEKGIEKGRHEGLQEAVNRLIASGVPMERNHSDPTYTLITQGNALGCFRDISGSMVVFSQTCQGVRDHANDI